jgi:hypothetical protein
VLITPAGERVVVSSRTTARVPEPDPEEVRPPGPAR